MIFHFCRKCQREISERTHLSKECYHEMEHGSYAVTSIVCSILLPIIRRTSVKIVPTAIASLETYSDATIPDRHLGVLSGLATCEARETLFLIMMRLSRYHWSFA